MKKLIPALCMLLVAACLMGTSTYAWFAANENVTASGMQVKAAADGGLAIASYNVDSDNVSAAYPATTDFAASAAAKWTNQLNADGTINTNATVKPTSTMNGVWVTANSEDANLSKDATTTYAVVDAANLKNHAQQTSFVIKSLDVSATTYTLKVASIALDGVTESVAGEALNDSIRVAICVTDITDAAAGTLAGTSAWYYFAPLSEATDATTLTYAATAGTTATNYTSTDKIYLGADCANKEIATGLDSVGVKVDVYVYYDGEDENCKSANIALNVDTIKLTINFSAE